MTGRRRGQDHPKAVLTNEQVQAIRAERGRYSVRDTAEHYGIGKSQVSRIQRGQNWNELLLVNEAA